MEKELEKKTAIDEAQPSFLKIHPNDNVLVALKDLIPGTLISYNGYSFELPEPVSAKHKFFVDDMHAGDSVIMYGTLVGKVQSTVFKGQAMTTANTKHAAEKYEYRGVAY